MADPEDTRDRWERAFLQAVEYDTWGQIEEATENYQRLAIAAAVEYEENILELPPSRRKIIGKLATVLKQRVAELNDGEDHAIGLVAMKDLKPLFKKLMIDECSFPMDAQLPCELPGVSDNDGPQMLASQDAGGTLLAQRSGVEGERFLSIFIEKWGFKDAPTYVEPHVVVSVVDRKGALVEPVQETPATRRSSAKYIDFGHTVHLQTPIDALEPGSAIFFELRHYKQKKRKLSVKAYCFMEIDEFQNPGNVALESYKSEKPTDFMRKRKPGLNSIKPLYLHLTLSMKTV